MTGDLVSGPTGGPGPDDIPAWMGRAVDRFEEAGHDWFRDHPPPPDNDRMAAVLMLFGADATGGQSVVLTERSHSLRAHPGQVSFPGGRVDDTDEHTVAAALREAEEEVGVDPTSVTIVHDFPPLYLSPSRNAVTPVLAWWHTPGPLAAVDVAEVARVVRVPVAELLDPAHRFTSVFGPFKGPGFEVDGLFVWGFTAMLLSALFDLGGLTRPWDESVERPLPERVLSPWMRGLSS